tara:strand:- start:469 stop:720 length:252 start_codon:yes stop_codon:yes gene_type:complete
MIALAITCLLVVATLVALLSATDSLLRGWRSYGALARELRMLRTAADAKGATVRAGVRRPAARPARRSSTAPHRPAAGLRAAA